jgi:hypothetical protein
MSDSGMSDSGMDAESVIREASELIREAHDIVESVLLGRPVRLKQTGQRIA